MAASYDQIREALARQEPGAEQAFHAAAAQAYQSTGNEISLSYYELVVFGAEHAQRQNLQTRAECLLRRAILIAGYLGQDPLDAKSRLAGLTVWPPMADHLSSERIVIAIDTDCRLWRWQPQIIGFDPTPSRPYRWYLLAPAAWRSQLPGRAGPMLELIFSRCNARLAAREPTDANYIGAQPTAILEMTRDHVLNETWQIAGTAWSQERAFVVEDSGLFFPADANDFVPMAHLALVTAGQLDTETSIENLRKVGFSGAILERQRQPHKELVDALAYYVRDQTKG
jgi:hypothetical protein